MVSAGATFSKPFRYATLAHLKSLKNCSGLS